MINKRDSFSSKVISFYYKDLENIYSATNSRFGSYSGTINLKVDKKLTCYTCVKTLVYSYEDRDDEVISSFFEQNQFDFYDTIHIDFREIGKCIILLLQEDRVNAYFYKNEQKFFLPSSIQYLKFKKIEISSFCFNFENGCPISKQSRQYLETYKKYHEQEIDRLQEKQDSTFVEIDKSFFCIYHQYFRMLGVDNTLVLPITNKTQKYKKILLKIKHLTKEETKTFSKISSSGLSQEEFSLYTDQLLDDGIELENGMNLLLLTFEEDDIDKEKFISEVLNVENTNIRIVQDNKGEIVQLQKIVRAIDQILSGTFVNPDLVNMICSNEIMEYYEQKKPFDFDIQESELYKKYPNLKNNIEQCICVEKILHMEAEQMPLMLVQGPPGTGKTELILTVIRELSKRKKNVLISSNVHVACNNIIERSKNDKELIIKRYSSLYDEAKYQEELTENQTRYVKNQVLEGFTYKGRVIDSNSQMIELESKLEQLDGELDLIESKLQTFQDKNHKYINYLQQLEHLKKSIKDAECEIERHTDKKIDLLDRHHTINDEKQQVENDIHMIDEKIETHKITQSHIKEQITLDNNEIMTERIILEKNIADKDAFISYIDNHETLLEECIDRIKKLNDELSLLKNLSISELRNFVVKTNEHEYTNIINKHFMSEYLDSLKLGKLFTIVKHDVATSNIEKLTKKTVEELYYNIEQIYAVDGKFIKSINELHQYYDLTAISKLGLYLGFNSTISTKSLKVYKTALIDTCKRVYYNKQIFIEDILKDINEQRLIDIIQGANDKIREFEKEIEKINADKRDKTRIIYEFEQNIRNSENKIQAIVRTKRKKEEDFYKEIRCSNEEEKNKQSENQKLKSLNGKLTEFVNNVNVLDNDIEKLEMENSEHYEQIKEIQEKISILAFHKGDHKNNIEQEYNLIEAEISTLKKEKQNVTDALFNIKSKLSEINETSEETRKLLFEYAKELGELSEKSSAEVVDAMSCNSGVFKKMFENTSHAEGSIVSMTTSQISQYFSRANNFNFDYVIIDEASKCNFQDLVISLPNTKHLVLIGDYMQLESNTEKYTSLSDSVKSIFQNEEVWNRMNVSPFSSLLHHILRSHIDRNSSVHDLDSTLSVLKRQYRMNKGIFDLVSPVYSIYKGFSIIDEKNTSSNDLLVLQVSGNEEGEKQYKNTGEILAVSNIIKHVYENKHQINTIKSIGIITGYRRQANELNRAIKRLKLTDHFKIEIGTIDRFQGKEFDLVILSMVRTQKIGFLKEIRRMNVAVSRAKKHLVIAGNFAELNKIAQMELQRHNTAIHDRLGKKKKAHVLNHETRYVLKYMIPSLFNNRSIFLSNDESAKHIIDMIKETNNATNNIF
ncbi:MAG: AAA domain-containing protein [Erysipelotrichaceae bacterium]